MRTLQKLWAAVAGIVLLGYVVGGRGFAYFGVSPVFIGDVVIAAGLAIYARDLARGISKDSAWVAIAAFCAWGFLRTVPYLSEYRLDALRDAVLFMYAAAAVLAAAHWRQKESLIASAERAIGCFVNAATWLLPAVVAITLFARNALPTWPGTNVPVIFVKPGDVMVHLGALVGICVMWPHLRPIRLGMFLLAITTLVVAPLNRGGMLAFITVLGIVSLRRGLRIRIILVLVMFAWILLVGLIADVSITPVAGRTISVQQLVDNILSLSISSEDVSLVNTKEWRVAWWTDIVDYTVFGEYRWTGKGFGVNLADDDGYQVTSDGSLRSPHNSHMTILARMGVPGFVLWIIVQCVWLAKMIRLAREREVSSNARKLALLLIGYCCGILINGCFDVSLESPVMGIWYWSIIGVGMALQGTCRAEQPDTRSAIVTPRFSADLAMTPNR